MIRLQGIGLPGIVRGKAHVVQSRSEAAGENRQQPLNPEEEKQRFEEALKGVRAPMRSGLEASTDETLRELYAAHLEMTEDPALVEGVLEKIDERHCSAEDALDAVKKELQEMFSSIDDPLIRSRFDDVRDIIKQIHDYLHPLHHPLPLSDLSEGTILVADEILPSEAMRIDFSKVVGIVCARGNVTSHVCIIARAKGIPAVIGADITAISDGDTLEIECTASHGPEYPEGAVVYANVSNAQEVKHALDLGVEGIGLFRTEFLLMQREFVPDEQNQYNVYVQAARLCGNKPLIIRTLDLGGDKVLPYMPLPSEENPALGLRGIRLTLSQPDLFKIQLRALLRASTEGDIRIMLPMVSSLDEVRQTKEMLQCCATDLAAEGVPFRMPKLGVMIETPAAVFLAEELARETDFFSIGTNDLVQYLLAADRGNNAVSYLYSAIHPAVLKAIRMVVEGAHRAKGEDFTIEVCGEAASQRESIAALWECGIRQFSVSPLVLES